MYLQSGFAMLGSVLVGPFVVFLSLYIKTQRLTYNIACTRNPWCWIQLNFKRPVVLLSSPHARCDSNAMAPLCALHVLDMS